MFTFSVTMIFPGFHSYISPNFMPLVAMPLPLVTMIFPEFQSYISPSFMPLVAMPLPLDTMIFTNFQSYIFPNFMPLVVFAVYLNTNSVIDYVKFAVKTTCRKCFFKLMESIDLIHSGP